MRTWLLALTFGWVLAMLAFAGTATAQNCTVFQQLGGGCLQPSASTPAPDPGGREEPNQPVPAPGKAFGFNLGYKPYGDATPDKSLSAMAALNVTHLRFPISWRAVLTSTPGDVVSDELQSPLGSPPPQSSVGQWDQQYLSLVGRGITPVMIVGDVPTWASTLYKCDDTFYQLLNSGECPGNWRSGIHFPHADFYSHFRQFVAAISKRYPKAVIEGPNEPDQIWNNHAPHRVDATTAGAIQCELHRAVRSVDSRPVLSMAVSGSDYGRPFIARAAGCYSAYSFHPYPHKDTTFGSGTVLARLFDWLRSARSAAGDTTPIWVTETGYDDHGYTDATRRLYNKLASMPDVQAVMFHTTRDRYYENDRDTRWGFSYSDWRPKPRMCTFVAMAAKTWQGC